MHRDLFWLLSQPLVWAVLGVAAGPYLFFAGFRSFQFKRRIANTPRSSIRGAALGPVEVSGHAIGPYTLVAPLSKEECLYYRLVVAEDEYKAFSNTPRELCAPLFVDDGTGMQLLYPIGADLRLVPTHQEGSLGKAMGGYRTGDSPDFVQEYLIRPGDPIFVFGMLQENTWRRANAIADESLSRIGPGFVSEEEADILRQGVFALVDSNLPASAASTSKLQFDLNPPTILARGRGGLVISTDSQREILSKLGRTSLPFIWVAPIWTLWAVWEILGDPRVWALLGQSR